MAVEFSNMPAAADNKLWHRNHILFLLLMYIYPDISLHCFMASDSFDVHTLLIMSQMRLIHYYGCSETVLLSYRSPLSRGVFLGLGWRLHRMAIHRVGDWTEEALFLVFWNRRWGRSYETLQSFHALVLSSNPMPYIHSLTSMLLLSLASIECKIQYGSVTEDNIKVKTLEVVCVVNILSWASC